MGQEMASSESPRSSRVSRSAAASAAVTAVSAPAGPTVAAPPRVGEQIQRLRGERRMTLDDLSRAAGVSKSMLSEIERDKA
ncbi:MAG TPA: helix-turn-helix transcriptional regulator, partial [Paraburkholderia sp.]